MDPCRGSIVVFGSVEIVDKSCSGWSAGAASHTGPVHSVWNHNEAVCTPRRPCGGSTCSSTSHSFVIRRSGESSPQTDEKKTFRYAQQMGRESVRESVGQYV